MTNKTVWDADAADADVRDGGAGTRKSSERRSLMSLGIVVERRPVANPWADDQYLPVSILPHAVEGADWVELETPEDEDVSRWHAATMTVELHRADTDAYKHNLESDNPAVYVVLRPAETDEDERPVRVIAATLSPYEAQDFLDIGDDIVEPVGMPEQIRLWVEDFLARHHKEEPFRKRKRKPHDVEEARFGKVLHPIEARFYERRDRTVLHPEDETEGEA